MKISPFAIGFLGALGAASSFATTTIATPSCGEWVHHQEVLKLAEQSVSAAQQAVALADQAAQLNVKAEKIAESIQSQTARWVAIVDTTSDKRWFLGFVSGLAVGSDKDFLRLTDTESIYLWVDRYCAQQPLDSLSVAGIQLKRALTKRNSGH